MATAVVTVAWSGSILADAMTGAKMIVEKYASKVEIWDGPTTGHAAKPGKTIVVLAANLKNGGILGAWARTNNSAENAVFWCDFHVDFVK